MRAKKLSGVAMALLFGMTSCACLIGAHDEGVPLMITAPVGEEPISCAVFFADNMVYAPQWRVDNYVRIETMVLDMSEYTDASEIWVTDTDLYPDYFADPLEQQAAIMSDSDTYLPMTKMVSVSYINVVIKSDLASFEFEAGWDPETRAKVIDDGVLGREVNRVGHLIYGMLWDTTDAPEGTYTVEVRLGAVVETAPDVWEGVVGEWYDVDYCIGNLYDPEAEEGTYLDPLHPFSDIVGYEDTDYTTYKIGAGGLDGDVAWVELGPLIPQGTGGGNGGESGGNGNGGAGGNGHGGRLSQNRGK